MTSQTHIDQVKEKLKNTDKQQIKDGHGKVVAHGNMYQHSELVCTWRNGISA